MIWFVSIKFIFSLTQLQWYFQWIFLKKDYQHPTLLCWDLETLLYQVSWIAVYDCQYCTKFLFYHVCHNTCKLMKICLSSCYFSGIFIALLLRFDHRWVVLIKTCSFSYLTCKIWQVIVHIRVMAHAGLECWML